MKKIRNLLALLLCCTVILGLIPVKVSASDITYTDFPFAGMSTSSLTVAGNNRLTKDITWTPTNPQMIQNGKTCRLDLNGHTLTIGSINASSMNGAIWANGGTIIIEDSSAEQTGKIIIDSDSSVNSNMFGVYNGGKFIMTGGTIECAKNGLYPLYMNEGTVEISGGNIISSNDKSAVFLRKGEFVLSAGSLQSTAESPIEVHTDISVKIEGGSVTYPDTSDLVKLYSSNSDIPSVSVSGGTFTTEVPEEYCADGYSPTLVIVDDAGNKGYSVHNTHTGGTATCTGCAVCELCGEEYGEFDRSNHVNLVKTEAKAATNTEEGNIEYYFCDSCDKYFRDMGGTQEITLAETVIEKLRDEKPVDSTSNNDVSKNISNVSSNEVVVSSPKTGDNSNICLWGIVAVISVVGIAGVTIYRKRKVVK